MQRSRFSRQASTSSTAGCAKYMCEEHEVMHMFLLPECTLISEKEGQIIVGLHTSGSDLWLFPRNRHPVVSCQRWGEASASCRLDSMATLVRRMASASGIARADIGVGDGYCVHKLDQALPCKVGWSNPFVSHQQDIIGPSPSVPSFHWTRHACSWETTARHQQCQRSERIAATANPACHSVGKKT